MATIDELRMAEMGQSRVDSMMSEGGAGEAKTDVNYREAEQELTSCGVCAHFLPEDTGGFCGLVAGSISPQMVCDLFAPMEEMQMPVEEGMVPLEGMIP